MWVNGTGFTETKTFHVSSFKVDTQLALKWTQVSNGNWVVTDRGASDDYYESVVTMKGRYDEIEPILTELNNNREAGSNVITLSNFVSDEKIFGADIIYTGSLNATVIDFPNIKQKSLHFFNISMRLRLLSPITFTSDEDLPSWNLVQIGYEGGIQDHTIVKYDTYTGSFTYLEEGKDVGIYKGTFVFSDTDMAKLRRYHAVNRGAKFTISDIPGVFKPFGPTGDTFPVDCSIKEIDNEKMRDVKYWFCDVELVNYKTPNS